MPSGNNKRENSSFISSIYGELRKQPSNGRFFETSSKFKEFWKSALTNAKLIFLLKSK